MVSKNFSFSSIIFKATKKKKVRIVGNYEGGGHDPKFINTVRECIFSFTVCFPLTIESSQLLESLFPARNTNSNHFNTEGSFAPIKNFLQ